MLSLMFYAEGPERSSTTVWPRRWAIVLMVIAFAVTWVSLRFSRGALGA